MNRENTAEKMNRNEEVSGMCLEDERIDDLQRNGYRIIQKKKGFCCLLYTSDAADEL